MQDYPDLMLIGKMGSGKTSGAGFLSQLGYKRFSIAGYHKGGIRDIADRIVDGAGNDREFLNWLGSVPDQKCWLRNLLAAIDADTEDAPVVVDDVRRELEYWSLKERGFVSIRIEAPEELRVDRLKVSGKFQTYDQLDGQWEHGLDAIVADYTIVNDDDPENFEDELINVLQRERRRR